MMARNLSPTEKRDGVRASFERKILILEEWARQGVPADAQVPSTQAELRRWEDQPLGITSWADPKITHPNGKNADLAARYEASLKAIGQRLAKSKVRRVAAAEAEAENLKSQVASLTDQNAALIGRLDGLERDNRLLKERLAANGVKV